MVSSSKETWTEAAHPLLHTQWPHCKRKRWEFFSVSYVCVTPPYYLRRDKGRRNVKPTGHLYPVSTRPWWRPCVCTLRPWGFKGSALSFLKRGTPAVQCSLEWFLDELAVANTAYTHVRIFRLFKVNRIHVLSYQSERDGPSQSILTGQGLCGSILIPGGGRALSFPLQGSRRLSAFLGCRGLFLWELKRSERKVDNSVAMRRMCGAANWCPHPTPFHRDVVIEHRGDFAVRKGRFECWA